MNIDLLFIIWCTFQFAGEILHHRADRAGHQPGALLGGAEEQAPAAAAEGTASQTPSCLYFTCAM